MNAVKVLQSEPIRLPRDQVLDPGMRPAAGVFN